MRVAPLPGDKERPASPEDPKSFPFEVFVVVKPRDEQLSKERPEFTQTIVAEPPGPLNDLHLPIYFSSSE